MKSLAIVVDPEQAESIMFHIDSALRAIRHEGGEGSIFLITTDSDEIVAKWQAAQEKGVQGPAPDVLYFGTVFVVAEGRGIEEWRGVLDA